LSLLFAALRRLRGILFPESDAVTDQTVASGVWSTLINVFDRVLQMGKLVVLGQLLAPSDFGLMGIALLTMAVFEQFSQLGFDEALIQRKESNVNEYLNTAWAMKVCRGIVLGVLAFSAAPHVASVFGEPRAADLIRVLALVPIITSFQNPGIIYFRKDLQFHKQFIYKLSGTVTEVSIAVAFALLFQNVWALVFGLLAGNVAITTTSYLIHGYRPSIEFNLEFAKELFSYGKWLTAQGGLIFIVNQGDDAFVGWFLTAAALGYYQFAYKFSNAPATEVSHVISSVAFPAYSKIQSDIDQLREGFYRTINLTMFLSFPVATGIAVIAPTFVLAFLGEKWLPIVPAMQVLAAWGLLRSLGATVGPLFNAVGRPDFNTKFQIFKVIFMAIFILPATEAYGIVGTAAVVVGHTLITNPVADYLAINIVDGSYRRFLANLAYPAVGSLLMGGTILAVDATHSTPWQLLDFILLVGLGVLTYAVTMLAVTLLTNYELRDTVSTLKSTF
jgi:O-antigen/teichoic acid export membrane protein